MRLTAGLARLGHHVIGVDPDPYKVDTDNRGDSHIQDVPGEQVGRLVAAGKLKATTDFSAILEAEAVSICVPTPLRKTGDPYQGDMLRHMDTLWKNWSVLDEVVRTGMPNRAGTRDHYVFIKAMHNYAVLRVKPVISALDLRGVKTALDLGGGPGTYGIELAKKGIDVILFDLTDTLEIAQEMIRQSRVRNISFRSGDFHLDDIGSEYDLVFLSQVLHSNGETRISPASLLFIATRVFRISQMMLPWDFMTHRTTASSQKPISRRRMLTSGAGGGG